MVSLVNSHPNAISKRWHLWEIGLRFALNSTPGWRPHLVWYERGEEVLLLAEPLFQLHVGANFA